MNDQPPPRLSLPQRALAILVGIVILAGWLVPLWLLRSVLDTLSGSLLILGWSFGAVVLFIEGRNRGWLPRWL